MERNTDHFIDFFVPPDSPARGEEERSFVAVRGVKRSLLAELQSAQSEGSRVSATDLLARWPTDPSQDRDAASVLFEDYQQRARRGDSPNRDEYAERFPEHKDSIAELFRRQDFLESLSGGSSASVPTLALPIVGDELFGFRLRHELGAGAFARVFLAEQADLAGRPVVLKVSDTEGDEPQTLAQMQHTNIVPIHSVHEDAKAGLRAVCMPYFGGAALSRVLETAWHKGKSPSQGQPLVDALALVGGPALTAPEARTEQRPAANGPLALLSRLDYVRACVWLVAQLADGLEHAHQRGVFHRDIKPSNILLGADGQPMLLDFNLAHHATGPRAQASATLGGTVAYMAPEHLRALAVRDAALVRLVDQRSDIYSLGMVLFEMLAGHGPFQQSASYAPMPVVIEAMALERAKAAPSLRALRPDAPWGLESILRKCLAPRQPDRYQRAADLAEDLRRLLDDLPLKHAPELSKVERLQKWLRRHPQATSTGSIVTAATVLLIAAGAALVGVRNHLAVTREELEATQSRERKQDFEKLKTRAFCLVNTTSNLQDNRAAGLGVLERALGLYGALERDDWQEHPAWRRLTDDEQRWMAEDTRELLLLLAWARAESAPGKAEVLHDALTLLDRAAAIRALPPSPALLRDRAQYLTRLGEPEKARAAEEEVARLKPATRRDHYLLATAFLRGGGPDRHARALPELDRAAHLNPSQPDFWTHMQRGICHLEMRNYALAAADFGICTGIWPDFAWGHFNQGLALDLAGHKERALACYTDALTRDSKFVKAWWNRGVAHLELGRFEEALRDCQTAGTLGRNDAALHLAIGKAREKLKQVTEAEQAFAAMFERLPAGAAERAELLCDYGFTVLKRAPAQAREAFASALEAQPRHRLGLYGMGLAAVETGRDADAIAWFSWALQSHRDFLDARSCRAVLYARQGDIRSASHEIDQCLTQDGSRGATCYDAACVMALAARHPQYAKIADPFKERAVTYLRHAFDRGFGRDKADDDADLASLRDYPPFQQLLAGSRD